MIAGFYLLFATLIFMRVRNQVLWHERKKNWVKKLIQAQTGQ
jgi:heme exporter protein C